MYGLQQELIIYRGRESIQHCITWSKRTVLKDCTIIINTKFTKLLVSIITKQILFQNKRLMCQKVYIL